MSESSCPDPPGGRPGLSRRDFVKTIGSAALVASVPLAGSREAFAEATGPNPPAAPETAVARFYRSLRDDQRKLFCFPADHPLRSQVQNNWAIIKPAIRDLSPDQQALCREIFKNLVSQDGHERFQKQMRDDGGGFENYHVALFGEPGSDRPFEWVFTGRHATLRADGNRAAGSAFGGPIFYGHAANGLREGVRHTDNVWWYQAEQANRIFQTLDVKQKARALNARAEPGLAVRDLDGPQRQMVQTLLQGMLDTFRAAVAGEMQEWARDADSLRLTYFKQAAPGNDGVFDVWKLKGPAFSWFYHGSPHVHSWLNVAQGGFGING